MYLWITDSDPGGPQIYGSGSGPLLSVQYPNGLSRERPLRDVTLLSVQDLSAHSSGRVHLGRLLSSICGSEALTFVHSFQICRYPVPALYNTRSVASLNWGHFDAILFTNSLSYTSSGEIYRYSIGRILWDTVTKPISFIISHKYGMHWTFNLEYLLWD